MQTTPVRPARFLKAKYLVALLVPALVVVLAISGFAWAQKGVTVIIDGESHYMKTQADTVAELLVQADIDVADEDVVTPTADTLLKDGMTIVVRHAVPVTLCLSGTIVELDVIGTTVADALVAAGADPGSSLCVEPSLGAPLTSDMTITADEAFIRVAEERVEVPYETVTANDPDQVDGTRSIVTTGKPGVTLCVYETVVTNGIEETRTLKAEHVIIEPIDEVVAVGTKRASVQVARARPITVASPPSATEGTQLTVNASAYAPGVDGVGTRTATGATAGFGIIAVDPRVIPLGTRLYIPGYGYGVAADTGGAIKGNKIDLCYATGAEALAWGRRTVTITILP